MLFNIQFIQEILVLQSGFVSKYTYCYIIKATAKKQKTRSHLHSIKKNKINSSKSVQSKEIDVAFYWPINHCYNFIKAIAKAQETMSYL